MQSEIKINRIWLSEDGRKVNYEYEASGAASGYLNAKENFYVRYDVDVSSVPQSILVIPLLANLVPMSWFVGFNIVVDELDDVFEDSLKRVKLDFIKNYSSLASVQSGLFVKCLVSNPMVGSKNSMLFSGGVDAYATYFRHYDENLDLVTVLGADISIEDQKQWLNFVQLNESEVLLEANNKHYIESNLRSFYTYKLDMLVASYSWWGRVQHGLALNSLLAPLSRIAGYRANYIASSYTDNIDILWGSTPEIDNEIKWSSVNVCHDGYELRRVQKIGLIVSETKRIGKTMRLRVCYSELNKGLNCSSCEKCYRTIMGLSLFGADPNEYGFAVSSSTYLAIKKFIEGGFSSEGSRYFWWELYEKMCETEQFVRYSEIDAVVREEIKAALGFAVNKQIVKPNFSKLKFIISKRYPKLFGTYLSIRTKF